MGERCSTCAEEKGPDAFPSKVFVQRNPKPRKCLTCLKAAKRSDYENNREARNASSRKAEIARRERDPQAFADSRSLAASSRAKKSRDYVREWRLRNPEKSRDQKRLSQGKRRASTGCNIPDRLVNQMKVAQNSKCWWCGSGLSQFHIDHRIPIARGGSHTPGNLVLACPPCNLSKGAKMPWEMRNGRLL